jgi:hypothetical protein
MDRMYSPSQHKYITVVSGEFQKYNNCPGSKSAVKNVLRPTFPTKAI